MAGVNMVSESVSRGCKGNPLPPRLSISNSASASDASPAFRRLFRLQMCLPLRDSSYASRPVSCTCLPRHISSPAVHLVSRGIPHLLRYNSSSAHPASGLALYRHPATSRDIMRPTMTSRNPRGTSHLPLAFRSRPGCPATSKDIPRLPLPLLPSHPRDIPRLPEIPQRVPQPPVRSTTPLCLPVRRTILQPAFRRIQ